MKGSELDDDQRAGGNGSRELKGRQVTGSISGPSFQLATPVVDVAAEGRRTDRRSGRAGRPTA
jgi:hypothetical protein